jgi:uncharacterized YigZ family protein
MYLLTENIKNEIEINKSRFICYLGIAKSQEEAKEFIQSIKKKHYDASHNCSAYILGETGEFGGSSDDGEPGNTAGVPMLEVLRKNHVTNIVAVVTRYYGGIKLGAGGLIRAYSRSVGDTLKVSNLIILQKYNLLSIKISYSYFDEIHTILKNYELTNSKFDIDVSFEVLIEENKVSEIITTLSNITNGRIFIKNMSK